MKQEDFSVTGVYYKIQRFYDLKNEWKDVTHLPLLKDLFVFYPIPLGYPTEELAGEMINHLVWLDEIREQKAPVYRVVHITEEVI
jgi:hypothetical protein